MDSHQVMHELEVSFTAQDEATINYQNNTFIVSDIKMVNDVLYAQIGLEHHKINAQYNDDMITAHHNQQIFELMPQSLDIESTENNDSALQAPMPATITAINVLEGSTVKTGDTLLILEAMKMEHSIRAPYDGIVKKHFFLQGQTVSEGDILIELEKPESRA